jgi:S-adenosylmethionine:tRNA ribosyltransferase-isomerase
MRPPDIHIEDYSYSLPEEYIAQYTLAIRDRSRLLVVNGNDITESHFYKIADFLPGNSLLVWNDTRVIHSRLIFQKDTGARIEIFCLESISPSGDMDAALRSGSGCEWKCMVGNAKKWKRGKLCMETNWGGKTVSLTATKIIGDEGHWTVKFDWNEPVLSWSEVLEIFGRVPLPPYIKREPGESDSSRYQTIYAANRGSVAAPTAGLHFTDEVIMSLNAKNIRHSEITLHVGEGTFKPVSSSLIADHTTHSERIIIKRDELEKILNSAEDIVAVGTTSLRTLESIYWLGVKTMANHALPEPFSLSQWEVYDTNLPQDIPVEQALEALLSQMKSNHIEELAGETKLIIVPGYKVRTAKALITNFHQPRSTLLLLVAAFAGPSWRNAYNYAIEQDFRFLSYGDACLFFRK